MFVIMFSFYSLKSKSNMLFFKEKKITQPTYISYQDSLSLSPVGDTAWLSWLSCSLSCSWGSWLMDECSSFRWLSWLSWWSCVCSRCSRSLLAESSLRKRAWNSQTLSCSVCTNTQETMNASRTKEPYATSTMREKLQQTNQKNF